MSSCELQRVLGNVRNRKSFETATIVASLFDNMSFILESKFPPLQHNFSQNMDFLPPFIHMYRLYAFTYCKYYILCGWKI